MAYNRGDTLEKVGGRLLDAILAGAGNAVSWRKPWKAIREGFSGGTRPRSLAGRSYRGINSAVLALEASERGLEAGMPWATYKGWQGRGAQVRKGEKGTAIIFWKRSLRVIKDEATGEELQKQSLLLRSYVVFHAGQVDGWKGADKWRARYMTAAPAAPVTAETWNNAEHVDAAVADFLTRAKGLVVRHVAGDRACYSPTGHVVTLPLRAQFSSAAAYYGTALHELTHATGHNCLLNRDQTGGFGSELYAKEELVAEAGAAMLCGLLGVPDYGHEDEAQHYGYISNWLRSVKREKAAEALVFAIQRAQKAAELIGASVLEAEEAETGETSEDEGDTSDAAAEAEGEQPSALAA